MRKFCKSSVAVFSLLLLSGSIFAQASVDENLLVQANKQQQTNNNAAALDLLMKYGQGQEAVHRHALDSIAENLQAVFKRENKDRISKETNYNQRITELRSASEDLERENYKMIRNSLLLFGLLTGIVVMVLLNRFRTLHTLRKSLLFTENRIERLKTMLERTEGLHHTLKEARNQKEKVAELIKPAKPTLEMMVADKQHPLHKTATREQQLQRIAGALLNQEIQDTPEEKMAVDLNRLIEEVQQQAYCYMVSKYPDFSCTMQPDLEKILPPMQLYPAAIRHVVFQLLLNAFEAVYEKKQQTPKGYDPKVSVVTRKLPRFIQVRIKDNGAGIPEKSQDFIFDPFYSLKDPENHSGLGLSESRRIIQHVHKGELFLESDFTSGTDFIIRFPINTPS